MGTEPDDLALLAKTPLFANLDDTERAALAKLLVAHHYDAGQTIFLRGSPGDALYLIARGRVQAQFDNDVGDTVVLSEGKPGDVFGEVALFDGGPRSATVVAIEPTDVRILGRDAMLDYLSRHPHAAFDLMAVMTRRLRNVDTILRNVVTRNPNTIEDEHLTFGQRTADMVAAFGGSWTFIWIATIAMAFWVLVNTYILVKANAFDPPPFMGLNLLLSTIAAIQAPVIMMTQNRAAAKDRVKADLDYQINLKAELEIAQLHRKVDRLFEEMEAYFARNEHAQALAHRDRL
jgi:uncharacterized membrane protein